MSLLSSLSGLGAEHYIVSWPGGLFSREAWEVDNVLAGHFHIPDLAEHAKGIERIPNGVYFPPQEAVPGGEGVRVAVG